MYAVKCYYAYNGNQFGEADYFDNIDDAYDFAMDMSNDDQFIVDIECPNGKVICV
jgi:hypothetical protein